MNRHEFVFNLCYHQISRFKTLPRQSKEEAAARLIVAEDLFVLAAAAAVRIGIKREATNALVKLMDEIHDHLGKFVEDDH